MTCSFFTSREGLEIHPPVQNVTPAAQTWADTGMEREHPPPVCCEEPPLVASDGPASSRNHQRVLRFTDVTGSVGTVPKIRFFSSFPKAFFRSCVFHVTFLPLYLSNRVKGIGKSKQNVLFRSGMFYSINIKNIEGFSYLQ